MAENEDLVVRAVGVFKTSGVFAGVVDHLLTDAVVLELCPIDINGGTKDHVMAKDGLTRGVAVR